MDTERNKIPAIRIREGGEYAGYSSPKKVSIIPAKPQYDRSIKLSEKKLRVAAYCRVSTELEEQESSYEAQVEYYTRKIQETENWKLAGIYADDGKSATNTKKRDDFKAMIKDAEGGKIDMILTKSVSRFARNTVDSLLTIRRLKEKNVAVVFEKEGVNTLDGTGEILITILSSANANIRMWLFYHIRMSENLHSYFVFIDVLLHFLLEVNIT